MSIFSKLFGVDKNQNSYAFRLKRARELHGQAVKYVTERRGDNDDVIGRGGAMAVHGDKFIIDSSGERILVANIAELEASYLMSGDGVIITAPNLLEDSKIRSVTVHFVYYRK